MSIDDKCSMPDCDKDLGPDALIFEHDGEAAGGICRICLDDAKAIRIMFQQNDDGVLFPTEITHIDKPL